MPSYSSYKRQLAVLDSDEIVAWFTTKNGVHIPLKKGQTKEEATKNFFDRKTIKYTENGEHNKQIKELKSQFSSLEKQEDDLLDKYWDDLGDKANEPDAWYKYKDHPLRKEMSEIIQKRGDIRKEIEQLESTIVSPFSPDKYYIPKNGGYMLEGIESSRGTIQGYPMGWNREEKLELEEGEYIELTKEQAMSEWAKNTKYGGTFGGLSNREQRSLETYTHFTPQNVALREGKEDPLDTSIIRNVISRTFNTNSEPVYRGVPSGIKEIEELKEGQIYTDKAFISTSPHKDIAKKFTGTSGYILKIKPALGFGKSIDVRFLSEKPEEDERILQAGSSFRVIKADHDKKEIVLEQL